ncbi:MAG TPA: zinc-regulated TonB-dependent outer membrane receptor, partial [Archangium sp.]
MSPTSCRLAGLAVSLSLCLSPAAWAQTSPDAGTPDADAGTPAEGASGEMSAEDLKAIEEALGSDAAAATSTGNAPAPTPAPAGTTTSSPTSTSGWTFNPANINYKGLELSFVLDVAAAAFTSKEPLQTGGHDPSANGFNFQQLEMSLNTSVDPYFRF